MAIHAQSSCTLSTITDVEAVYTYYYLSDSTITVNEAPKDNINPPGASTITVVSGGENYVWQITEPELNVIDNVIQTAVGKLYVIECVKFSDNTYDWGPLMTSSTYTAAKAAYNLSSQALAQATAANNATALLGGHFIYNSTWSTTNTPYSANVVQTILKNGVDKTQVPSEWEHNVHIGSNGISLRYNEAVMAQLAANQSSNNTALRFYKPPTVSGNMTTPGALTMELTSSALNFYGSSTSTADVSLTSTGLNITNGSIQLGTGGSSGTSSGNITLSNVDFARSINGTLRSNLRLAIGSNLGVKNDGTLYASNAVISGTIIVGSGSTIDSGATIGGTSASTVVNNASTGAGAASDLATYKTTVSNTYATQEALSDVEQQIPDVSGLAPKSSAIAEEQRIYYRSNAVSNNSPIKPNGNGLPTTWVTETGDKYNSNATTASGWSRKITPIASGTGASVTKYLYLWTCIQRKTVSGDVTYGDILLDDSTTVKDGRKIITGSVTANEITGSKLSAIYADMGNITAGNITKGYNSINFDNSPATLEFKNNSSWANATKGIQWTGSDLNIKGNITATSLTIGSGATVSGLSTSNINGISDYSTKNEAQGYANTAEANASYSIEIKVTAIDYANSSATLVAVPYYQGSTTLPTLPSGASYSYQWYRGTTALSNTSTVPTISGATTTTLELGQESNLEATYVCVISKP